MNSYINPLATFVPGVPWQNEDPSRVDRNGVQHSMVFNGPNDPSFIVIHTTACSLAAAENRFVNPGAQVSAHYLVDTDGAIYQMVDEKDASYANGSWDMNLNSITIEHVDNGNYNSPRPDALYAASAKLVKDICDRYGIPILRTWIIKHTEVPGSSTACPDSLDIDRIVSQAQGNKPPEELMTRQQKAATAKVWYAIYLNRLPDMPATGTYAGLGAHYVWGDQIADDGSNMDEILNKFLADAATERPFPAPVASVDLSGLTNRVSDLEALRAKVKGVL